MENQRGRQAGGKDAAADPCPVSLRGPNPRSDDYAVQFIIDDWFICDDMSINDNDVLQF